jgi:hypothetical protein
MNITSGNFTAPITGLYYFGWTGLAQNKGPTVVSLVQNGYLILASAYGQNINFGLNINSIVSLRKGDQIMAVMTAGNVLYDDKSRYTNFIGMFLG